MNGFLLPSDPSGNFPAMNGDVRRGFEAQLDASSADLEDHDGHALADGNTLPCFAAEYEHVPFPPCRNARDKARLIFDSFTLNKS
jgi:hypothetical protein